MSTNEINTQRSRRWLYGVNFVLVTIVAIVLLGFAMYLTTRLKTWGDATSSGIYSLSPKTKQLLGEVDKSGQKIEVINLFGDPSVASGDDASRVADLLREYGRTSKTLQIQGGLLTRAEVEQKIKERYADEMKPYEQAVKDFDKLITALETFFKGEAAKVGQVQSSDKDVQELIAMYQEDFESSTRTIARTKREINRATESTLPEWPAAVSAMKKLVEQLDKMLKFYTVPANLERLPAPLKTYFTTEKESWTQAAKKAAEFKAQLDGLKELKVQNVLDNLSGNSVVVLGDKSAKVIGRSDIFKFQQGASRGETPRESFEGEQAISSALLSTLRPDKLKVVFVSPSPQGLTTRGYREVAGRLREANFDVLEWSPTAGRQNPMQPEAGGGGPPPAEGKDVIWIIFPPEPPSMQMMQMGMMPPSPKPVVDAAMQHVAKGGSVLIFAESGSMGDTSFAYAELTKPFGIDVQPKYTVIAYRPVSQSQRQAFPLLDVTRYPEHEISKPVQGLRTRIGASMGELGLIGGPTVVQVSKERPANVDAKVFIESPADSDHWAESEYKDDASFDKLSDIAAPVPMAVAAIRDKGVKDKEQRVAVIGARFLGIDQLMQPQLARSEDEGFKMILPFPGNGELFTNTVLWLAGYENMISVSAKADVAQRIGDITPGKLFAWRLFLIGGLPVLMLVAGGVVWFMRRR